LDLEPLNQEAKEALDLVVATHGVETLRNWSPEAILTEAEALLRRSKFKIVA
jgi:hypothetical protein